LAFLFFAITSLRQRLKKQAQRPSSCGGRFNRRENPAVNLASLTHTERLKNFFLREFLFRFRDSTTLRKKFSSSIAHIKQSSKKFFGEKQQRWSRARCSRARFFIGDVANLRVGLRARSNDFFGRRAARSSSIRRTVACERSTQIRATLRDAMRAPTRKRAISSFGLRARRHGSLGLFRKARPLHAVGGTRLRSSINRSAISNL